MKRREKGIKVKPFQCRDCGKRYYTERMFLEKHSPCPLKVKVSSDSHSTDHFNKQKPMSESVAETKKPVNGLLIEPSDIPRHATDNPAAGPYLNHMPFRAPPLMSIPIPPPAEEMTSKVVKHEWTPTEEQRKLFEEWKSYCIGYLVSCPNGIKLLNLLETLKDHTGEDVPLQKMGLGSVYLFLYEMSDSVEIRKQMTTFGYGFKLRTEHYVLVRECAVPEHCQHVRKMVLEQRKMDRWGNKITPIRNNSEYCSTRYLLEEHARSMSRQAAAAQMFSGGGGGWNWNNPSLYPYGIQMQAYGRGPNSYHNYQHQRVQYHPSYGHAPPGNNYYPNYMGQAYANQNQGMGGPPPQQTYQNSAPLSLMGPYFQSQNVGATSSSSNQPVGVNLESQSSSSAIISVPNTDTTDHVPNQAPEVTSEFKSASLDPYISIEEVTDLQQDKSSVEAGEATAATSSTLGFNKGGEPIQRILRSPKATSAPNLTFQSSAPFLNIGEISDFQTPEKPVQPIEAPVVPTSTAAFKVIDEQPGVAFKNLRGFAPSSSSLFKPVTQTVAVPVSDSTPIPIQSSTPKPTQKEDDEASEASPAQSTVQRRGQLVTPGLNKTEKPLVSKPQELEILRVGRKKLAEKIEELARKFKVDQALLEQGQKVEEKSKSDVNDDIKTPGPDQEKMKVDFNVNRCVPLCSSSSWSNYHRGHMIRLLDDIPHVKLPNTIYLTCEGIGIK